MEGTGNFRRPTSSNESDPSTDIHSTQVLVAFSTLPTNDNTGVLSLALIPPCRIAALSILESLDCHFGESLDWKRIRAQRVFDASRLLI
jgi:hypothetical protein